MVLVFVGVGVHLSEAIPEWTVYWRGILPAWIRGGGGGGAPADASSEEQSANVNETARFALDRSSALRGPGTSLFLQNHLSAGACTLQTCSTEFWTQGIVFFATDSQRGFVTCLFVR